MKEATHGERENDVTMRNSFVCTGHEIFKCYENFHLKNKCEYFHSPLTLKSTQRRWKRRRTFTCAHLQNQASTSSIGGEKKEENTEKNGGKIRKP